MHLRLPACRIGDSAWSKAAGLLALAAFFVVPYLSAQTTPSSPRSEAEKANEGAFVSIPEHGWGPRGELVLAVKIHASKKDKLALGGFGKTGSPELEDPSTTGITNAFSLQDSYLVDLYSKETILPLGLRPPSPYFGPESTIMVLKPRGWIQLGVAFPHPPEPPMGKDGKRLPYRFLYYPPNGLEPVKFEPPAISSEKTLSSGP